MVDGGETATTTRQRGGATTSTNARRFDESFNLPFAFIGVSISMNLILFDLNAEGLTQARGRGSENVDGKASSANRNSLSALNVVIFSFLRFSISLSCVPPRVWPYAALKIHRSSGPKESYIETTI